MKEPNPSPILAKVVRNERLESLHRGCLVVVDSRGALLTAVGDPDFVTYIRSAAKPFQIMPLLNDGADRHFGLSGPELAVIMASHNAEAFHVETVRSLLQKLALEETALKCAFHPPMHKAAAKEHLLKKLPKSPLFNNCSGKHSGMLALAKFHGWPLDGYLDADHPVQQRILQVVAQFAELPAEAIGIGVDGCSAPNFYLPVKNMALMYAKLAGGEPPPGARVFELMTAHPEMIAGSERFDTELMRATRGRMVSKVGAEGIRCLGVRGSRPLGLALKIEDGSKRASEAIVLAALEQLGLISEAELRDLGKYRTPVIVNHAGIETGRIEVCFDFGTSFHLHNQNPPREK